MPVSVCLCDCVCLFIKAWLYRNIIYCAHTHVIPSQRRGCVTACSPGTVCVLMCPIWSLLASVCCLIPRLALWCSLLPTQRHTHTHTLCCTAACTEILPCTLPHTHVGAAMPYCSNEPVHMSPVSFKVREREREEAGASTTAALPLLCWGCTTYLLLLLMCSTFFGPLHAASYNAGCSCLRGIKVKCFHNHYAKHQSSLSVHDCGPPGSSLAHIQLFHIFLSLWSESVTV